MSQVILDSKHTVVPITGEEDIKYRKLMTAYTDGMIRLQPGGWYFNSKFVKFAKEYYNFKTRSTDVIIMAFQKSGTTWTQEILWTMINNSNLDNPDAALPISTRVPFLELDRVNLQNAPNTRRTLDYINNLPDPRVFKTHIPFSLLPPKLLATSKVIYIARNPKAVCVSNHHHCSLYSFEGFYGTFDEYLDLFLEDKLVYCPFFPHILEAWKRRSDLNLLFLFYEDMKNNPQREYKRIDDFLGTKLSQEQLENEKLTIGRRSLHGNKKKELITGLPKIFNVVIM